MASPQPDYFVRFSKELLDAAVRAGMPATQLQVFLAVVRRTYGDRGKRAAPVSVGYLVQATGRARSGVKTAYADLLEQGVLVEVTPAKFSAARVVAIQKDYEHWGVYTVDPADIPAYLRRDWQQSLEGQKSELGQQPEQGHEDERKRAIAVNAPGPAERTEQGQQTAPFQDQTSKTRHPEAADAGHFRRESTRGKAKDDPPPSLRQTTCDGKPRADCRALSAITDGTVQAALEQITGRGGAARMHDPSTRLGHSIARLCDRTCSFSQVEYAATPRPTRDQQCSLAINRAFAAVAAYHSLHGIKHLPAFLDAKTTRAEGLYDLVGGASMSTAARCHECGVDLTFDEAGEHCPVCGRRVSAA